MIDAGFDMRRVTESGNVGDFNRDWERHYTTATLHDLGAEGLALSVTADRWNGDDNDTSSLGADVSYAEDRWRACVGSYYSLYKHELLELAERDDVRTYYLHANEDDLRTPRSSSSPYEPRERRPRRLPNTLRLGAVWRFWRIDALHRAHARRPGRAGARWRLAGCVLVNALVQGDRTLRLQPQAARGGTGPRVRRLPRPLE